VEDWRGAQDLFESEAEALGDADPERRREVWLRVGDIGRDHTGDLERALLAYTRAAEIRPLPATRKLEIAKLNQRCGHLDAHAEVLGQWCDDPDANASATDHTELATVLEGLDRPDAALERARRALELERAFTPALDLQAKLLERRGDRAAAAAALARASERVDDAGAALRLLHAAELVEGAHGQAAGFLRSGAGRDPGNAFVHAHLARVEFELGSHEEAERAAECALDLLSAHSGESDQIAQRRVATLQCEVALIGGRCASLRGRVEIAANFYARAHAAAPDDAEALARYGESLGAIGDFASARVPLEMLLGSNAELSREERARYLVIVGRGHEESGELEEARRRFEGALQDDPSLDAAHDGLVNLHRRAGRIEAGIACLDRWAGTAEDPADFGARMLQAAEWEIEASDRDEAAERHLRSALDALPENVRAWQLLASLLWDAGRVGDALEVSTRALAALDVGGRVHSEARESRAALALVQARAHESEGRRREAAESFGLAASAAPDCTEAVLGQARLLRATGEWREAAEALSGFVERHRGEDPAGLAQVLQHLGRLLAGPLEDVDGAVAVYRRAVALDPDNRESREMLAGLLSVRPGDWDEARGHHELLLDADPANARLLQMVLRAAQSRGADAAVASGARILDALGVSSPCAERDAPEANAPRLAGNRRLSDPLWEKIRCLAQTASQEISTALESSGSASLGDRSGGGADFRTTALAAEADLIGPALLPLTDAKLGEILTLLAALALDPERARGEGQLVNALSSALGRRTRRRIQKILSGESLETIERIDFSECRNECRALAGAVALDTSGGSLRAALVALACTDTRRSSAEPDDAGDITSLVSASPEANALLRRVVRSWLASL